MIQNEIISYLRDPLWQFIGIVVAVVAFFVPLWMQWRQRNIREISFGLVSSRPLLRIDDEVSARIRVELDGKKITDLQLQVFGLKNSGTTPIRVADFERAIELRFASGQVISAQISSEIPANLKAELAVTDSSVQLKPLLLNPGDQIVIQILCSPAKPPPKFDARIVGITKFQPINTIPALPKFHESGLVIPTIAFALIGLFGRFLYPRDSAWLVWISVSLLIIIYGYSSRAIERSRASSRRRVFERTARHGPAFEDSDLLAD